MGTRTTGRATMASTARDDARPLAHHRCRFQASASGAADNPRERNGEDRDEREQMAEE